MAGVSPAECDRPRRARTWVFRALAATLIPFLLLAATEAALRLGGFGVASSFFVEAGDDAGTLVANDRFGEIFFPPAIARSPRPVRLSADPPPPPAHYRVFLLGGSAAMGDPDPAVGLGRMVEALLESRHPDRTFEVVNTAMTAINSHVVLPIARDCAKAGGAAWVIYMGNNEVVGPFGASRVFGNPAPGNRTARTVTAVRKTRLGQLLGAAAGRLGTADTPGRWDGMAMFVGQEIDPVAQADSLARVGRNFAANLDDILGCARRHAVPVVLCTVASNLADCPPFASVHRSSLSGDEAERWRASFEAGLGALARDDPESALAAFDRARAADGQFAELEYQRGQALLALGRPAAATLASARDLDALPFRAGSEVNDVIRAAAENQSTGTTLTLVDTVALMAAASPAGVPGENFFHEHVHLNAPGNYLVARHVAEALEDLLALPATDAPPWPGIGEVQRRLGWTALHQRRLLINLRDRLRTPPFDGQSNSSGRLGRIDGQLEALRQAVTPASIGSDATTLARLAGAHPDDWQLRQQFASFLDESGSTKAAAAQWREVARLMPHHSTFYQLGRAHSRAGEYPAAAAALRESIRLRPDSARAHDSLGIALAHTGDTPGAYAAFQRAGELDPASPDPKLHWAMTLEANGDVEGALAKMREAAAARPGHAALESETGRLAIKAGHHREALPHYTAAASLEPNNPTPHLNLGLLLTRLGRPEQAAAAFRRTLELDPDNAVARTQLEPPGPAPARPGDATPPAARD